ncbi:TonB-dependent receptor [uncultured Thalassospira sp.]|uniref:TonB-dependent siderophore receptor n=1 Tax=uncultured Thalassospira sp. TaxID=404382 RepID=UPI00259507BF|nr:TonB-dependent receptor [uncultured Thalassospira sp.]
MASKRGTSAMRVADHHNMRASQRSIAKQLLAGTAMSLGAMMLFAPVDAQAAQAAQAAQNGSKTEIAQASATFDFAIASQNLNDALLAFAQQTGIQIFYDTAQVENLISTAVNGKMTAAEALGKLLEGSDVKYSFTDDNSVTLVAGGDAMLDPVVVEAQGTSNPGDPAATEGTGSFTTTVASVGSKGNESLRELPQTASVVTSERIEQQNFQYLDDAMRYTTGVQVAQNTAGRSSLFSRGYEVADVQTNGVSVPLSSRDGTLPNLAMYDRIEVLRGPAGLYGGSGEPSATINLIRKQANDEFSGAGSVGYGSWNHYSAMGDVSVPLTEDGSVRTRAILSADYRDSFVDVEENNNELGYVTFDADISDDTFVSLGFSHEHKDQVPHNGLPAASDGSLLNVSRSTFAGADWNTFENTMDDVYLDLKHQFSDDTEGAFSLRFSNRNMNAFYAYTISTASASNTASYRALDLASDEQAIAADAYVNHNFDLFGYEQTLTVGADIENTDFSYVQKLANLGTASISSPSLSIPTSLSTRSDYDQDSTEFGTYAKLKLQTFDDVTFSFGGRTSWYNSIQKGLVNGSNGDSNTSDDSVFTPFAGVVYGLTEDFSTYFSYTSIYDPQSETTTTGSQIEPRTGEQFEIGVKGEHFGGLLNSYIAAYQMEDENRAVTDPNDTNASVAAGQIRTRGIEAELSGEIMDNWQGFVGYTYIYSTDIGSQSDSSYRTYAPKHYITSWTDYTFDEGAVDGLSVGGGVTWSDGWVFNDTIAAPSYTVVDARVAYQINDNLSLALNANNVLDEKYYSRVASTSTFNYYGAPRNFFLSLNGTF